MHVIKVMCKKGLYTLCAEFILTQRSHFLVFLLFRNYFSGTEYDLSILFCIPAIPTAAQLI